MNGASYIAFDNSYLTQANTGYEHISFSMKTNASEEFPKLLVFYGQPPESLLTGGGRDYLALALVEGGHLVLLYELGSGEGRVLLPEIVLSDNKVHTVEIRLTGRQGLLTVDEQHRATGSSSGALTVLNVDADIFIGGVANYSELPGGLGKMFSGPKNPGFYFGYSGCIWDIRLGRSDVLDLKESSKRSRNIAPCDAQS